MGWPLRPSGFEVPISPIRVCPCAHIRLRHGSFSAEGIVNHRGLVVEGVYRFKEIAQYVVLIGSDCVEGVVSSGAGILFYVDEPAVGVFSSSFLWSLASIKVVLVLQ